MSGHHGFAISISQTQNLHSLTMKLVPFLDHETGTISIHNCQQYLHWHQSPLLFSSSASDTNRIFPSSPSPVLPMNLGTNLSSHTILEHDLAINKPSCQTHEGHSLCKRLLSHKKMQKIVSIAWIIIVIVIFVVITVIPMTFPSPLLLCLLIILHLIHLTISPFPYSLPQKRIGMPSANIITNAFLNAISIHNGTLFGTFYCFPTKK